MTLRKFLVVGAAIAALGVAAGSALAQTADQRSAVNAAKSEGVVGEQADGYLGFREASSDPALQAAVRAINDGRRQAYQRGATEAGVSADVAAARMFESQLLPRVSSGQWYKNAQGQWVRR